MPEFKHNADKYTIEPDGEGIITLWLNWNDNPFGPDPLLIQTPANMEVWPILVEGIYTANCRA